MSYGTKTKYGHFSASGKEYIITRPDTPSPWMNFLFNNVYHAIVSQTGGGFSYYKDPKFNRILRYDHISTDRPGRYIFIHDHESKKYWSANWQPIKRRYTSYECHHGLGYTQIKSETEKILSRVTYLVSQNDPAEIYIVSVKNHGLKKRELSIFPYVDLISGDAALEEVYHNIMMLYNRAEYVKKGNYILAYKMPFPHRMVETYTFFYSSLTADGFDANRERFLGKYGSYGQPEVITSGQCKNTIASGEDMVGVLQHKITLNPGEEKTFVCVLGFVGDKKEIRQYIQKYGSVKKAEAELKRIKKYWQEKISSIVVETPDPNFNLMVNIWGRYQLFAITHWRGTSAYHGGEGGLGYRDTCQDCEGLWSLDTDLAMEKLLKLLFYQYNSGHAVSGFSDLEGPWDTGNPMTGKSDVAVWLPFTVIQYLKETGNLKFLDKTVKFFKGGEATVYEHILRAVRYIYSQRGKNGLTLICKADWNDAYDMVGGKNCTGESIWLTMALARACRQMEELALYIKDKKIAAEMRKKYQTLYKIINKIGWDGNWYLAAINFAGYKIGSSKNKEGKVPLNSQTWAILSKTVTPKRLPKILDKIDNYLSTEYGPALFLPSYTEWNPGIGRVTSFAPGTKENAAVFSHACAFKIVADCEIGRGNEAYKTFTDLMPTNPLKAKRPEHYKVEPFVFAEYTIGPGHPDLFGQGAFTWNTGTVPWVFVAATEWILGARRDFNGLLIDPCLPKQWKTCSIRRPFRGAVYEISIKNPRGVEKGVKSVSVDGKKIEGQIIRPHGDGKVHKVEVLMG